MTASTGPEIVVDRHGHTTVITLNRPDQMNAFTTAMRDELEDELRAFEADPSQRVAIITGAGDRAFCAGADLKEMAADTDESGRLPFSPSPDIAGVAACEKITIAAVNGLAVAGGLELAIGCDIRLAAEHAWFGLMEVRHGFLPGVAVNVLPRLIPIGVAMDMMVGGERLHASAALNYGLVQRVVPAAELLDAALEKAEMVAAGSPTAVWGTKQVVRYWRDLLLADQQRHYEAVLHRVLLSGDFREGPRAFAEKRPPAFSRTWPDPFAAG